MRDNVIAYGTYMMQNHYKAFIPLTWPFCVNSKLGGGVIIHLSLLDSV